MHMLKTQQLLILIVMVILFFSSCNSTIDNKTIPAELSTDGIAWLDITELEEKVKAEPKPIFIMIHANWCPHCKRYQETTYQNPKVINELNQKYHAVKMNAHDNREISYQGTVYTNPNYDSAKGMNQLNSYHELLYAIQAKSIPSLVFINSDFNHLGTELGFKEADEFRSLLNLYQNQ